MRNVMHNRRSWVVVAVLLAPGGQVAVAEGGPGMDTLYKLEGRWKIEEQYPAMEGMSKGAIGRGDVTFKKALGGAFLVGDYKSKARDLNLEMEGQSLFSYDEDLQQYRYWWFDSYGNSWEFTGQFDPGAKALTFSRQYPDTDSGDMTHEKHTFKFEDDNVIVFTMEFGSESRLDLALTTTYVRRGTTRSKPQTTAQPKSSKKDRNDDDQEPPKKKKPRRRPPGKRL